jgi:hypothetical protein
MFYLLGKIRIRVLEIGLKYLKQGKGRGINSIPDRTIINERRIYWIDISDDNYLLICYITTITCEKLKGLKL